MIYNILQIFTKEHHKLFSDVAIHFSQLQFFLIFLPLGNICLVHLSMYVANQERLLRFREEEKEELCVWHKGYHHLEA